MINDNRVPVGYRNWSEEELTEYHNKFHGIYDQIEIAFDTWNSEIAEGKWDGNTDRLDDIARYFEDVFGIIRLNKGENYIGVKKDLKSMLISLATAHYLAKRDYNAKYVIENHLLSRDDLTDEEKSDIEKLLKKMSLGTKIKEEAKEFNRELYNKQQESRCFIATAAYGTPYAYQIDILRYWRDNELSTMKFGRFFINCYYKISPSIAQYISKSKLKRRLIRIMLKPILKIIKKRI